MGQEKSSAAVLSSLSVISEAISFNLITFWKSLSRKNAYISQQWSTFVLAYKIQLLYNNGLFGFTLRVWEKWHPCPSFEGKKCLVRWLQYWLTFWCFVTSHAKEFCGLVFLLQWGFVSFMDADGFWFFGHIWNIQFLIVDSAPNSFQVALNHNYWRILPTYEEICLVCIMVCSKFWSDYFVRINCWKPMSSMGGYGSLSLPFMIKGMLWHFFTQVSGSLQVTA